MFDEKKKESTRVFPNGDGVFHIAKQMARPNQYVTGKIFYEMRSCPILSLSGQVTSSLGCLQLVGNYYICIIVVVDVELKMKNSSVNEQPAINCKNTVVQ